MYKTDRGKWGGDDKMYFEVDPLHFQPQCNLTIIGIIVAKRTFFDAIDNFFY